MFNTLIAFIVEIIRCIRRGLRADLIIVEQVVVHPHQLLLLLISDCSNHQAEDTHRSSCMVIFAAVQNEAKANNRCSNELSADG